MFYNIIGIDTKKWQWTECNVYVARTRKRTDGIMGDFVKYYKGNFCEAGNFGKETPIVLNAWHPRVAYLKKYKCYVMSSAPVNYGNQNQLIKDYMEIRTSTDLIKWSDPIIIEKDGKPIGNHYQAIISYLGKNNPYVVTNDKFTLLHCHNGTNVKSINIIIK